MIIKKTKFKDLIIIQNNKFSDRRGSFKELFKGKLLKKKLPFVVTSFSRKNVIRGLHIQLKNPQGKFVSVIKGKIFDVSLDLRPKSKTFGKIFAIKLSEKNCKSIFIPEGFAHGFCGMDRENYIIYACSKYRNAKSEISIKWNDNYLNIKWPIKKPIISKKDKKNISFKDFLTFFSKINTEKPLKFKDYSLDQNTY